jgi:menaquinone-dependent protoporphyrinogen IX oxidase
VHAEKEISMGKVAVVYKSKYGSAKQYAQWIAEETGGTLFALPKVKIAELAGYDTVIIGGGLYAGAINGIAFLEKNFAALEGKKLIAFSVGTSADEQANTDSIKEKNFTPEVLAKIGYFHLRGGLFYTRMNWFDKTLMKFFLAMMKRMRDPAPDEGTREILESDGKDVDFATRGAIAPIVAAAKA